MKNLIKVSLLLTLALTIHTTQASTIDTYIKARGGKSFSIHHNKSGNFQFTIKDQSGNSVFTQRGASAQAFVKTFDVTQLPVGMYTVEIEDETKVSMLPLEILSDSIVFYKNNTEKVFKPTVIQDKKRVDISMLKPCDAPLNLSIYNINNERVHKVLLEGDIVNKRFDLSNLPAGNYVLYFEVGDMSFKKSIQL